MNETETLFPTRRRLLQGGAQAILAAAALAAAGPGLAATGGSAFPDKAEPFPMEAVRLTPSPFLTAVQANQRYLHDLEPDRLLHNFRFYAGLKPKGEAYGGWEAETIAGHTLGHYLSAVSLMYAQTGDPVCKAKSDYIVSELAEVQKARGDGYVAGFTRTRDDKTEDGKLLFAEWERGDIRQAPFYINGCWVPLYNFHKSFAGLMDAQRYCGNEQAMQVALGLGGFVDGVFAKLSDAQVQQILECEHGGINESFAEIYARTRDPRWLALGERMRFRKILDPLTNQQDDLDFVHANCNIPKLIGLARLYEVTGKPGHKTAATFFWNDVTGTRSYVIGGNADREYFTTQNSISKYITEQTCESCNTYNMLKLTRHLYQWSPDAAYFDYYERAHLNHILAQHDPQSGMFAYMVPLASGAHRNMSTPYDDFWCCVGTGMESHSKHGDSIYWRSRDHLFVNLFIPSVLTWQDRKASYELKTAYPFSDRVSFEVTSAGRPGPYTIALRIPAWCAAPALSVNGERVALDKANGYARVTREWKAGDRVELVLPMQVRAEPTHDDPSTIALLHGPLVLAADLGPIGDRKKLYDGPTPALVGVDVAAALKPAGAEPAVFRSEGIGRPGDMTFRPFYQQVDQRTAVYFKRFTEPQWQAELLRVADVKRRDAELEARSIDVMRLGDEAAEKAHGLDSKISYDVSYRFRPGRDARTGGFFQFHMKSADGPLVLRATYWGDERNRTFKILVDGQEVASQKLEANRPGEFFDVDYPLPEALTRGKSEILVRFDPDQGHTAGPVFGCRLIHAGGVTQA